MDLRRRIRFFGVALMLCWSLFVLYPNPLDLGVSVYRLFDPPIEPYHEKLEKFVNNSKGGHLEDPETFVRSNLPYRYDWEVYGMPWYFPTVEEVLLKSKGDCKAQSLLIASLLELQGAPYRFFASPTHIWVDYEGKKARKNENSEVALVVFGEEDLGLKRPDINWRNTLNTLKEAFWDHMPKKKKTSLVGGIVAGFLFIGFPGIIKDSSIKEME